MSQLTFKFTQNQFIILQNLLPKGYFLKKDTPLNKKFRTQNCSLISSKNQSISNVALNSDLMQEELQTNFSNSQIIKQHSEDLASSLNFKEKSNSLEKFSKDVKDNTEKKQLQLKTKKLYTELLNEIQMKKSADIFLQPVNPVKEQIPHYFTIVKEPMDLNTMRKKVMKHKYKQFEEFKRDLELIVWNCLRFNAGNNFFIKIGQRFDQQCKQVFEKYKNQIENLSQQIIKYKQSQKNNKQDKEKERSSQYKGSNKLKIKESKRKYVFKNKRGSNTQNHMLNERLMELNKELSQHQSSSSLDVTSKSNNLYFGSDQEDNSQRVKVQETELSVVSYENKQKQLIQNKNVAQCQIQNQKKRNQKKNTVSWRLSVISNIRLIKKQKLKQFFKLINFQKGQTLDFKTLSDSKVREIEQKLIMFNQKNEMQKL